MKRGLIAGLVIGVLVLVYTAWSVYINKKSKEPYDDDDQIKTFRPSLLAKITIITSSYAAASLPLLILTLIPNRETADWVLFSSLFFVFFILAFFATKELNAFRVTISQGVLEYRKRTSTIKVSKNEIQNAYAANGQIVILLKNGKRIVFPAILSKCYQIIQFSRRN